jgi:hypothetical protein
MRRILLLTLGLASLGACAELQPTAADSGDQTRVVQLQLADESGRAVSLSRWQGQPLLIFIFSTSDTGSQLALTHIEHWLGHERSISVLGIALQPDARLFLAPYRDALGVSFPLTYDPQDVMLRGQSDLGSIVAVPSFVLLDAQGRERARHYGVLEEAELQDFVEPALRR